ncbi:hypothetical protein Tco_0770471 [Tanacetum coccineum]|uniref:Uncharacterized protein n=1 Tax=Tanacetum coccineum TaxID=301880 RepID=A0ABQ4ZFP1_9ASTR
MHTRASNSKLVEPLPEPERTLNRRLHYDLMDDEPMWAADRVVAPTPGSAITIPETANEFAIKENIHGPQNSTRNNSQKSSSFNQNLETKFDRLADKKSGQTSGSLPINIQPNPRGSNSKAYQPLQARNEHVNAVFTRSGKSYNPPEKPNEEQNKTKNPINFDRDDEDDESTPQPKI